MIAFPQFRLQTPLGLAQLGERHGMQKVVGSSPIGSIQARRPEGGVLFCIHFSWLFFSINLRTLGVGQSAFMRRPLIFLTFSVMGSRGSRLL